MVELLRVELGELLGTLLSAALTGELFGRLGATEHGLVLRDKLRLLNRHIAHNWFVLQSCWDIIRQVILVTLRDEGSTLHSEAVVVGVVP